jgi:hypothetical protein
MDLLFEKWVTPEEDLFDSLETRGSDGSWRGAPLSPLERSYDESLSLF